MTKSIKFLNKEYSNTTLAAMSTDELLELRNLVASNLGVPSVRAFKDHNQAIEQTWKALEKFDSADADEAPAPKAEKAPKAPKEPKERKPAKSSAPSFVKRPTSAMFATITKVGEHNGGSHGRAHRWSNYKDGMTLVDVIEADGTEPWDVHNWVKQGIMTLTQPTQEEYLARRAAWYEKNGQVDPDLAKIQKAQAAAEAKAAKTAELEAKKAEREKAKAEKAAAAEAKKAAAAEAKAAKEAAKAAAEASAEG